MIKEVGKEENTWLHRPSPLIQIKIYIYKMEYENVYIKILSH